VIRKAELKDKTDISRLHYMAAPNIFNYFFAGTKTALAVLDRLYEKPDTIFSKDFFWVNEENGTIKGAISIFPGKEEKLLEKNIGKYGKELAQIMGFFTAVKMIFRGSLSKYFPTINDDELYIQALAVFPEYRGQRIASPLLRHAFGYARQIKLARVSLLVETPNEHAVMVYKKYGFRITTTQTFKSNYRKHRLYGIHKVVAEVPGNQFGGEI
jgi:ribosomal protein S18 acetylase RimI-like enzyme